METVFGRIHSMESFGAVDGPGIRFVVFLQGCMLRCLYCHNPDTWECGSGIRIAAAELVKNISTYKSFISSGGVTISGGEPLMQPEFCEAVIDGCHKMLGLHTAIDTSGMISLERSSLAIEKSDMLLLDIKEIDSDDCKILTGFSNENTFKTLDFCEKINKDVWIRHVLLPEYTLNQNKLERLGKFLSGYKCIKKTELLPYHTMGMAKWEAMDMESKLVEVNAVSADEVAWARGILGKFTEC